MGPEQRGQAAPVGGREEVRPLRFAEDVLKHQGVHVDQGRLQNPQAQHEHLLLVAPVRGDLPALAVGDHGVGAVGGLHDVQALLDLPLKVAKPQVAGYEDGLLRDGGPRSLPRREGTVWLYLNRVRPALLEWSDRYDHLREVTRDDVLAYIKTLHGHQRHDQLVALRSLFTWAKRNGLIFRNPTSRIKVGQYQYGVLQPLAPAQVDRSVAAATTPATRLILALAAVHAARVAQIGTLMLDDVDLGNRRLTIARRVRPLDDLTMKLLLDWLKHR